MMKVPKVNEKFLKQVTTVQICHTHNFKLGTAHVARRRVRAYFQQLRDQLCVQEVAALTVVDTHIRERMCSIRQQQEDMATVLSQVAEVCIQCDR